MTSVTELSAYLAEHGHEEACKHAFSCDPWKYEPHLLEDLMHERSGRDDPRAIAEIRGMIRAGSWMSYPRPEQKQIADALEDLRKTERHRWDWKIRQSDPDTSRELAETKKEALEQIDRIQTAIAEQRIGEDAEAAARIVEDLDATLWLTLKAEMRVHGLSEAGTEAPVVIRTLHEEIERLRPIRDLIYFRRLYPKLASRTLGGRTVET